MADLGAIPTVYSSPSRVMALDVWSATHAGHTSTVSPMMSVVRLLDVAVGATGSELSIEPSKAFGGIVTLLGLPVVGARVLLMHSRSMVIIRESRTDAGGEYSFAGLLDRPGGYLVVVQGRDAGVDCNLFAFDKLTAA